MVAATTIISSAGMENRFSAMRSNPRETMMPAAIIYIVLFGVVAIFPALAGLFYGDLYFGVEFRGKASRHCCGSCNGSIKPNSHSSRDIRATDHQKPYRGRP